MTVDLVMKDGDWFLLSDLDSPISFKIVQLGKILSQTKKKGQVVFSYEFPEDTKFPKKKGRKKALKKVVAKKNPLLEEPEQEFEAEETEVQVEKSEFSHPDEVAEDKRKFGRATKIKLNPKLQYVDDKKVGQSKADHQVLARVIPKPNAPTKLRYFKLRCSVHGGDVTVPEWEYNKFKEFGCYRCNRCCGGG